MKPVPRQNPPVDNVTGHLVPTSTSEPIDPMADEPVSLPLPTLEYLLNCSKGSLQDVELSNLRAANCLKQARIEWNAACTHREAAGVARWLIENREALLQQSSRTLEVSLEDELPNLATIRGPKKGLGSLLGAPGTVKALA
jgi:hypothetical protein